MKKTLLISSMLLVSGSLLAATVTFNGTTYTLQSATVNSDGNWNITATGPTGSDPGSTAPDTGTTPSDPGSTPSDTDTTPPVADSSCPTPPAQTTIIDIGTLGYYTQKQYKLGTNDALSFRFTTDDSAKVAKAVTAFTTVNPTQRLVTVSKCPGDFSVQTLPAACVQSGSENTTHFLSQADSVASYQCKLERNTVYYINVRNQAWNYRTPDIAPYDTCPSNNCPFFFKMN